MLVVDAANVVGSRPDGWWRDRAGAAARLVSRLRRLAGSGERIVVVLEGAARAGAAEADDGWCAVVHAPADGDEVVARLAGEGVLVVTADRALAARVRAAGGEVVGPGWLLKRLDEVDDLDGG
jgi:hypothetical protein